jgi:prophage maintenance system killer protein
MRELTVDELLELHQLGFKHGPGNAVVPHDAPGRLSSVLYTARYYQDNVLGYAAGILCYIARAQIFIDGNKRVAFGGCVRALEVNGFTLNVGAEEAADYVLRVVNERLDVADIAEQLAEWLVELA